MGLSFRVAPGVRIRASSRGLSAGLGPRAARVHVGTRGVGVSSGVGPISGYQHLSGGSARATAPRRRSTYGPTKAQIAAHERELKAAQREADIEKVAALEAALTNVHHQGFPQAKRAVLPDPDPVDPAPIERGLEAEAGLPALLAKLGGGEAPPLAPDPEPVDRYALLREHRRRERQGIPIFKLRQRVEAARRAEGAAEADAEAETEHRLQGRQEEQLHLDGLWEKLQETRATVADRLRLAVSAESDRRQRQLEQEQTELDAEWEKLRANEPLTTMAVLEEAFADNHSPAAPINCEGQRTTVVMQFPQPEEIVPERKPARTPTGKPTLKKRNKTETNALYLESLASNVLATVKEALAVAPGTEVVQILVIRREIESKLAGQLAAIYLGEFPRGHRGPAGAGELRSALTAAPEAVLNLKGKTEQVAAIDLGDRADLHEVLKQVAAGLEQ